MANPALFPGCQSLNPKGRPVGATEKPWLRPGYWHDLIIAEWDKLKPGERASIAMKGFATVMPKVLGPQSPEESVQNAQAALSMLKMLQDVASGSNAGTGSASDKVGVEDGRPEAQTQATSVQRV